MVFGRLCYSVLTMSRNSVIVDFVCKDKNYFLNIQIKHIIFSLQRPQAAKVGVFLERAWSGLGEGTERGRRCLGARKVTKLTKL